MNIIILLGLIINAHAVPVISEYETTLRDGYANESSWQGGTLIYAHNYLSGVEFYNLEIGEIVTAYYSDGSTKEFQVIKKDAYAFGNSDDKLEMRVDQQWIEMGKVINMYSAPDSITLFTCYPEDGQTTGRLFVELNPLENGASDTAQLDSEFMH
jgi:hypothetical protein